MRMQVILDSPFARLGSAPIGDGKKGEFRDWTIAVTIQITAPKDTRLAMHSQETNLLFNNYCNNFQNTLNICMKSFT